ncbi:hypothetical protein TrVE_jg9455 [Triparma verrucosa]|uniref:Mannitol dehydrogenase N-terminal domain-containing protein n=1 Tax=Triparma verrucosa TaxID=1606542 RepID=A0A9W7C6S8_9STRA|nr:hypothetical protein TrVE_jg9455 [Triparma verrucosa]
MSSTHDENLAVVLGSGRFIRSVLLPLLPLKYHLFQPRSNTFLKSVCGESSDGTPNPGSNGGTYEYDVVDSEGGTTTKYQKLDYIGSLNSKPSQEHLLTLKPSYILVGLTEAGITPTSPGMIWLSKLLKSLSSSSSSSHKVSLICTDNLPQNGTKIKSIVLGLEPNLKAYLEENVTFHDAMVDCIVSYRPGSLYSQVPMREILPSKTIVISPPSNLPTTLNFHNVSKKTLSNEVTKKLLIANATHTAIASALCLEGYNKTDSINTSKGYLKYLDELFDSEILPTVIKVTNLQPEECEETWKEWRVRLSSKSFGLSTYFISQGSAKKVGIRLKETLRSYDRVGSAGVASVLRYLTGGKEEGGFRGETGRRGGEKKEYAPGLYMEYGEKGEYLFKNDTILNIDGVEVPLPEALTRGRDGVYDLSAVVSTYLKSPSVGLPSPSQTLVSNICKHLRRLYSGESFESVITHLDVVPLDHSFSHFKDVVELESTVDDEVDNVEIIDLHTHLLPSEHSDKFLTGIDELLNYHYLVSEYIMSSEMKVSEFMNLTKERKTEVIWNELFIRMTPVSEATRGVVNVLKGLGMAKEWKERDLNGIRSKFLALRASGDDAYEESIFSLSKIKYAVMTNIPFSKEEMKHFKEGTTFSKRYRTALRVDPLLEGDWGKVKLAMAEDGIKGSGIPAVKKWVKTWCSKISPEYLMASTPKNFTYESVDMTQPGAFATNVSGAGKKRKIEQDDDCCEDAGEQASRINESSDLLKEVLLPLAEELQLPLALKIGCDRQVNPTLGLAGDGIVTVDMSILLRLLQDWPKVKFLVTFLSLENQHSACVLKGKFRNLHIYGCWWYVNQGSLIERITRMRLEMLGTNFTFQHSDCRVLEQLLYKWKHSREALKLVLRGEIRKVWENGGCNRADVRKVVERITGGSYEEFLKMRL